MSAAQRRKGAEGEREVCALLHKHGWPEARRNFASGACGGADVTDGPKGYVFEVKRRAVRLDIPAAIRQAADAAGPGEVPVVAHRRDGDGWYATLPLPVLLELLAEREGRSA